jgi:hypothetical protein
MNTRSNAAEDVEVASVKIAPQPGGQTNYFTRTEYEVLFGGSAGPGKSWALVVDALGLQFKQTPLGCAAIDVPSYRGVMFRRKTTEFTKLIDETRKYYPHLGGVFLLGRRGDPGPSWNFPSGARIFICHMEREGNKHDHDGQEYQFVGFDELTQFTLTQYLHLLSRTRTTVKDLWVRVRSTTNPMGAGLSWVRSRFIKDLNPKQTYYFTAADDPVRNPQGVMAKRGEKNALSRAFVPGYLHENLILMENDPTYAQKIMQMGKAYRRALLENDWYAFSGTFFKDFVPGKMVIDPFEIPKSWYLWGSLDPGYSSPCSFGLHAKSPEGNKYRIATYYERERNPEQNALGIKEFIKNCKETRGRMPEMIVSGLDAWAKNDKYAIIANEVVFADVFLRHGLVLQKAATARVQGWWLVKQLQAQKKWFVFDLMNEPLVDEMTAAEADERQVEDIKGRGNDPEVIDHAIDEERYACMAAFTPAAAAPKGDKWMADLMKQSQEGTTWKPGMR